MQEIGEEVGVYAAPGFFSMVDDGTISNTAEPLKRRRPGRSLARKKRKHGGKGCFPRSLSSQKPGMVTQQGLQQLAQ